MLKERFKKDKASLFLMVIYLLCCMASMIYMFCIVNIRNALLAALFMLFIPLILIVERLLKIRLGPIFLFLLFFICLGAILGTGYEFYIIFPHFDSLLHGLSGFLFACLGFALMKLFLKENNTKSFFACMIFGVCFSLAIAVFWEMFEYSMTFLGLDMLEDTIIDGFESYLLAGSHNETIQVDGITKTIIWFSDGQSIELQGYLDIGLIDTLHDLIICVVGSLVFMITTMISFFFLPSINEKLIPTINNKKINKILTN